MRLGLLDKFSEGRDDMTRGSAAWICGGQRQLATGSLLLSSFFKEFLQQFSAFGGSDVGDDFKVVGEAGIGA